MTAYEYIAANEAVKSRHFMDLKDCQQAAVIMANILQQKIYIYKFQDTTPDEKEYIETVYQS